MKLYLDTNENIRAIEEGQEFLIQEYWIELTTERPTQNHVPLIENGVHAGWLLVEPEPEPITQVSRAQGKAALISAGLWSGVVSFVNAIPDDTQRALAEVALHDTTSWQRNSPFLSSAAEALDLTEQQLDDLFLAASQIVL